MISIMQTGQRLLADLEPVRIRILNSGFRALKDMNAESRIGVLWHRLIVVRSEIKLKRIEEIISRHMKLP